MRDYRRDRYNWSFNRHSVREMIEKNEHIKRIREKLARKKSSLFKEE